MKKIFYSFILSILTTCLFAQAPYLFKYQAAVRNSSGELVKNTDVAFRIKILKHSETGTLVYTETHNVQTNAYGVANLIIGNGTTSDDLSTIDWTNDEYFISIETDLTGGTNYQLMGVSQLLSVPYALHANISDSTSSVNATNITAGTLNTSRYSSIADLTDEGMMDNNAAGDILTREQADDRYIPQVAFSAYNSSNDAGTASVWTKVEFNTEIFDEGNNFSTSTDRFVAPVAGVYNFSASVGISSLGDNQRILIVIRVNGATLYYFVCEVAYGQAGIIYCANGSATIKLNASDYAEIYIYSDDASFSIYGGTSRYTQFSGHLVFPSL